MVTPRGSTVVTNLHLECGISRLDCDELNVKGEGNRTTRAKPPPNSKSLATFSNASGDIGNLGHDEAQKSGAATWPSPFSGLAPFISTI